MADVSYTDPEQLRLHLNALSQATSPMWALMPETKSCEPKILNPSLAHVGANSTLIHPYHLCWRLDHTISATVVPEACVMKNPLVHLFVN